MRNRLLGAVAASFFVLGAGPAAALDCDTVEFIVPFSAGGGTDTMARSLAPAFEQASGITTQVVNITGADGLVGKRELMSRPADGCSLMAVTLDYVIFEANGIAEANLLDLLPLYRAHVDLGFLHAAHSVESWDALKAAASEDDPLLVGGLSSGSFDEAAVTILLAESGVPYRYIPYDKSGEMHADLIGERIHLMYEELGVAQPMIEGEQIRPLLVAFDERLERLPDVPAASELGLTVSPPIWRGVAIHKDTPAEIVAELEGYMKEAAKAPEYQEFAKGRGLDIVDGVLYSAEFSDTVAKEREAFGKALGN